MNFGGTIRINRVGLCIIVGVCILLFYYLNSDSKSQGDDIKNEQGTVNLKRLLISAIQVASKGGEQVVSVSKKSDIKERSKGELIGGVKDPLTLADDLSHCVMYYTLKQSFPKLKIISEEKSQDCPEVPEPKFDLDIAGSVMFLKDENVPLEDITVWMDPLDATKEYTEKLFQYVTTMVCVAVKGKPVIGVIHKPFDNERNTYWGWVGKGVSKQLQSPKEMEKGLKITVSRSHAGEVTNITEKAFNKNVEVVIAAGAGYKVLEVVQRHVTAYVHVTDIKKWDICAGNAIVNAVGGKMTTLKGAELDYSNDKDAVNKDGLLADVFKHDWLLEQLSHALPKA